MSLSHILLAVMVGGLFVVMMYMFIRVLFMPTPGAEGKTSEMPAQRPKPKKA